MKEKNKIFLSVLQYFLSVYYIYWGFGSGQKSPYGLTGKQMAESSIRRSKAFLCKYRTLQTI